MPDRYGEDPAPIPSRQELQRRAREVQETAERIAIQARRDGISRCRLCNDDGYVGGQVCDHVDHTETARRGMAMVRAAMGWTS